MYESTTVVIAPKVAPQQDSTAVSNFMDRLVAKNPGQPEFRPDLLWPQGLHVAE